MKRKNLVSLDLDAVRNSRAGDVFHYRWAARRCLRMLDLKTKLNYVVIEGSSDSSLSGEYVMDVTEYLKSSESDKEDVNYFQLKHSVKRVEKPFQISELKNTIEGYANRFRDHLIKKPEDYGLIKYFVITNRALNEKITTSVKAITKGENPNLSILKTLRRYTKLNEADLKSFCSCLEFIDSELGFDSQKKELHFEMGALFAGAVEQAEINNLVALIQQRALPEEPDKSGIKGKITREDVLKLFGVTNPRDMFPAPAELEKLNHLIRREQHGVLLKGVLDSTEPIIIKAEGGVGKSVFCQQLANSLPDGSLAIIYDCFGAGNYLNKSQPRHRYRDALLQIANEIAIQGYCDSLILRQTDLDDSILRGFLSRIKFASEKLKQENPSAILALFIDAADNAEMAASDASDKCFVNALLEESYPDNCRIVALCRAERIHLLRPKFTNTKLDLHPFTEAETLKHLRTVFRDASEYSGLEFHKLTGGSPRVQANALALNNGVIGDVLSSLGPGMNVDEQISQQLQRAISRLKEMHAQLVQSDIDAICMGLANFPPYIPIEVLAAASKVDESTIRSFVADLGRPLWLSENHIQFRDEPTETWFRNHFSANAEQLSGYIERIKELTLSFNYVAEVVPVLLHKAGQYDQLVKLALSEEFLPESPIDKRNVRLNRLQFAFKSALKQKYYVDAAKLALLAGEEMAGDKRQLELLSENVDLIAPLQSKQRVQELAFRRMLSGDWAGSENIYSASLLSTVEDFKGEAQGYLRSAKNWMRIYFEDRKKNKNNSHDEKLDDLDIAEMAFAILNIFGVEKLIDFINSWRPKALAFRITKLLAKRLADITDFEKLDKFSILATDNIYIILAINDELNKLGKIAPITVLQHSLEMFGKVSTRPKKERNSYKTEDVEIAIISFCEACAARSLDKRKILKILNCYFPVRASQSIHSEYGQERERNYFLKVASLRTLLSQKTIAFPEINLELLMPENWLKDKANYDKEQDVRRFKEVVGALLPWYLVRTLSILGNCENLQDLVIKANLSSKSARANRYREHDSLPYELTAIRFEVIKLCTDESNPLLIEFIDEIKKRDCAFLIDDSLNALRVSCRVPHLKKLMSPLERFCREQITVNRSDGSESVGGWYIELARAVLSESVEDAKVYFDLAIDAISKFGDELVGRWDALVGLAKRAAEHEPSKPELAYKFIQCAELVGENVYREKHWDRDEAIQVCFKLHKPSAFAAISRWRDREIGWFDRQFSALLDEAVQSKYISGKVGWSLSCLAQTSFLKEFNYLKFVKLSIENENDWKTRQFVFDKSVRDFRLSGGSKSDWDELLILATKYGLNADALNEVLHAAQRVSERGTKPNLQECEHEINYFNDWDNLFNGLGLIDSTSLNEAVGRFENIDGPRHPETFWQELYKRTPEANISLTIQEIIQLEHVDYYDIMYALSQISDDLRGKISVQKVWPKIIKMVGKRFANNYVNWYVSQQLFSKINANDDEKECLNLGILEGLETSCQLEDGATLFSFCNIVASYISPESAVKVLTFGLDRFNEHIDSDFADGNWSESLLPPENSSESIAGLIWSALGSPRSRVRWKAAHTVRRLVETGSDREVDELVNWLNKGTVNAFGSSRYPFYKLHANLYLLIALARAAKDNVNPLLKHSEVFAFHALASIPHVLIQKLAAEVALQIEKEYPSTYTKEIVTQLQSVGRSRFPIMKLEGHNELLQSPWHINNQIEGSLDFNFSYDFDRYWFEPLARVFGISSAQVADLAKQVVLIDWKIKKSGYSVDDPRLSLWKSNSDRETWHTYSEYPKTDNYHFYISYHAMLSVASKLLEVMHVVQRYEYEENEWIDWLKRHFLSCGNGDWLSDRRDPPPIVQRAWLSEAKSEIWRWEIKPEDFLEGLLIEREGDVWVNVWGQWSDADNEHIEDYSIMSAFVDNKASSALLNALTTCSNPHDYKLPNYLESGMEFKTPPFELVGWICRNEQSLYLDELDPFSGSIPYPPYSVGNSFAEKFGLTESADQRIWSISDTSEVVLLSELWANEKPEHREAEARRGNRMIASISFLQRMCSELGQDLIVEVQIKRRKQNRSYKSESDDEINYTPAYSKVYLLSGNGALRDATTSYRVGQGVSKGA